MSVIATLFAGSAGGAAAQTLTLDLQAYPKDTVAGGYWSATYNEDSTAIRFGEFVFSHSAGWGGIYWDGFTYATNGDLRQYGTPCPVQPCDSVHGGSQSWIDHQWGVMAGGGLTTPPTTVKGAPYLVGYWGYYEEMFGSGHSLEVSLADNSLFSPQEVWVCNHPWPYWGNIYGDGFARPFHEGDYFKLKIHAVKYGGAQDSIEWTLAEFNSSLEQSPDWQQVSLDGLFDGDNDSIQYLYFTMESTDELIIGNENYGPNTAVYFCLDKLKVTKTGNAPARKSATSVENKKSKIPVNSQNGNLILRNGYRFIPFTEKEKSTLIQNQ